MGKYQAVRFWILFFALLGFLMLWPLTEELSFRLLSPEIFRDLLLLASVVAVSNKPRIAIVLGVLAFALVISHWLFEFGFGTVFIGVTHGLSFVIMLIVSVAILAEVLRAREVTSHLVVGAVCVYLTLALTWSFLYYVIEALDRGAILAGSASAIGVLPAAQAEAIKMLYISLASISTLGNGDIPVTFLARQLAAVEAITGQLYLAVLIARLVGFSTATSLKSE